MSKIRSDSTDSYDKTILQLSTGALAITIAFLEKIGKPYSDITNLLITVSWIGFLFVIILNLLSFYFARENMNFKIQDLDDRYKKYSEDSNWPDEKFSCYKKATEFCNAATLWLFFGATVLFVVYAIMVQNYSYEQTSKNKRTQEVTMSEKKVLKEGQTETIESHIFKKGQTETTEPIIIPKPEEPLEKPPEKPKK